MAELKEHARDVGLCQISEPVVLQGFDKEQEQRLRKRKRSMLTEAEKWKEMYKILFPYDDDDSIPSPCRCFTRLKISILSRRLLWLSQSTPRTFVPRERKEWTN
jgi:hypothetical protein